MHIISRKEARAIGNSRYFTGKPCTHGHTSERRTSNALCIECSNGYNKIYSNENSEKLLEYRIQYYQKNKKAAANHRIKWRLENSIAKKESDRKYRINRPEVHRNSIRNWSQKNKAKVNAIASMRRASILNATPCWADRHEILKFYQDASRLTDETGIAHHVDHIVPLRGKTVCGLHVSCNLQVITARSNESKGNYYWPDMWDILL